jgi:putative ABC transport system substrate-binding protein
MSFGFANHPKSKKHLYPRQMLDLRGALVGGSMFFNERRRVGAAAVANKIAVVTAIAEMVPFGLLISYGPDFPDFFKRSASLVGRILNGRRPADLPVEQPTRFKQVLNVRTAKQLRLIIPEPLLVTTDELIE